jgi:hypothetical protein
MKLPPAYFCTQDCFTTFWAEHCKTHEKPVVSCVPAHADGVVCCRHREKQCLSGSCGHSCCTRRAGLHKELAARYSLAFKMPLSSIPEPTTAPAAGASAASSAAAGVASPSAAATPTSPVTGTVMPADAAPAQPMMSEEESARLAAELKAKNDRIAQLEERLKAMAASPAAASPAAQPAPTS